MDAKRMKQVGHKLSGLLRHGAVAARLTMDAAGWAPVSEVLGRMRLTQAELDAVVSGNNKSRYEVQGGRIRASQGHSLGGKMPVTQAGLEATWARYDGADPVWHGTRAAVLGSIRQEGILRGERSHVHLAEFTDSAVGKRAQVEVLLELSVARLRAAGEEVWRSPNGVVLTRHVPPGCITGLEVLSRRHQGGEAALRVELGLDQ